MGDTSRQIPDDVGVREFLQEADLSYDAVLVHVILVDLHHHHLPTGAVHHLKDIGGSRSSNSSGGCISGDGETSRDTVETV